MDIKFEVDGYKFNVRSSCNKKRNRRRIEIKT